MTKKIAFLSGTNSGVFSALEEYFKNKKVEIVKAQNSIKAADSDLCIVEDYKGYLNNRLLDCCEFINIHYSLLPAFEGHKPIEKAFNTGVKVSGVTVNYLNNDGSNGKIIAQYPVFIDVTTTLQEFEEEMYKVAQKLVPFAAESVLDDKVFNFGMLLKPQNCSNSCGGCSGCGKKDIVI